MNPAANGTPVRSPLACIYKVATSAHHGACSHAAAFLATANGFPNPFRMLKQSSGRLAVFVGTMLAMRGLSQSGAQAAPVEPLPPGIAHVPADDTATLALTDPLFARLTGKTPHHAQFAVRKTCTPPVNAADIDHPQGVNVPALRDTPLAELPGAPSTVPLTNKVKLPRGITAFHNFDASGTAVLPEPSSFKGWGRIDKLIYWGGSKMDGPVLVPSKDWIDAAHRNGAQILGTLDFQTKGYGGEPANYDVLFEKDSAGNYRQGNKLIDWALKNGFDGWLFSFETPASEAQKQQFAPFLTAIKRYAQTLGEKGAALQIEVYGLATNNGGSVSRMMLLYADEDGKPAADVLYADTAMGTADRNTLEQLERKGVDTTQRVRARLQTTAERCVFDGNDKRMQQSPEPRDHYGYFLWAVQDYDQGQLSDWLDIHAKETPDIVNNRQFANYLQRGLVRFTTLCEYTRKTDNFYAAYEFGKFKQEAGANPAKYDAIKMDHFGDTWVFLQTSDRILMAAATWKPNSAPAEPESMINAETIFKMFAAPAWDDAFVQGIANEPDGKDVYNDKGEFRSHLRCTKIDDSAALPLWAICLIAAAATAAVMGAGATLCFKYVSRNNRANAADGNAADEGAVVEDAVVEDAVVRDAVVENDDRAPSSRGSRIEIQRRMSVANSDIQVVLPEENSRAESGPPTSPVRTSEEQSETRSETPVSILEVELEDGTQAPAPGIHIATPADADARLAIEPFVVKFTGRMIGGGKDDERLLQEAGRPYGLPPGEVLTVRDEAQLSRHVTYMSVPTLVPGEKPTFEQEWQYRDVVKKAIAAAAGHGANTIALSVPGLGGNGGWQIDAATRQCVRACAEARESHSEMAIFLVPNHSNPKERAAIETALTHAMHQAGLA